MSSTYYPIESLPKALEILWCYFPVDENPGKPGPRHRPCLVRRVAMDPDTMRGLVEVAYGTTKLKRGERPLDLRIVNFEDLAEIGLPSATRFDLDRTLELPWTTEYFGPHPKYPTIYIGKLNARVRLRLETLRRRRANRAKTARR